MRQRAIDVDAFPQDQQDNFLEMLHAAQSLFDGDLQSARHWVLNPVKGLGDKAPAAMAATRAETEIVLDFISRLEHGVGT